MLNEATKQKDTDSFRTEREEEQEKEIVTILNRSSNNTDNNKKELKASLHNRIPSSSLLPKPQLNWLKQALQYFNADDAGKNLQKQLQNLSCVSNRINSIRTAGGRGSISFHFTFREHKRISDKGKSAPILNKSKRTD